MTSRTLAWAAAGLTLALAIFGIRESVPLSGSSVFADVGVLVTWAVYAAFGALIVTLRPGQPIGLLFVIMGLTAAVSRVAQFMAETTETAAWWLALLSNGWVVAFTLLAYLMMVFPDGKLPSRRWRLATLLAITVIVVGLVSSGRDLGRNPVAILLGEHPLTATVIDAGQAISGIGLVVLLLVGPWAMIRRFIRARGIERQQLKWFAYGSLWLGLAFVTSSVAFFTPALRALDPDAPVPPAMFGAIPLITGLVAIPVAAGLAILRYRLYDIDLIIRRTLVYGALSATLAAVYIGLVIALQGLLTGFTGGNSLAVAASTLAVAALFQPIRRRIQTAVDRRFYRSRYDAARTLGAFSSRLRDEVDLAHLTDELRGVVAETLQPASVSVWVKRPW
ncbi:MAG: hypothetical protein ABIW50_09410 [Candidatus Limnocylindria bacterium]